jgi:hypothetical protein
MKQRVFEVRNMHTAIHELWVLKKGTRVKTIQNTLKLLDNYVNEEQYERLTNVVYRILENYITNSFEVNFRDKDNNGNYEGYEVVNKNHVVDVY